MEMYGNRIGRISVGGSITEFPLPTPSSYPWGITAGPDGNLWFTEAGSNRIGRITPAGVITTFPLLTSSRDPIGITVGPDGALWFVENESDRIMRAQLTPASGAYVAGGGQGATIVTGAGAGGGGPRVRAFDAAGTPNVVVDLLAYAPGFAGGVRVASCDVNGDGASDLVTAAGPGGGPHVRVLAGTPPVTELASFFAYDPAFAGGVFVACGDADGDGRAEVITGADAGGGPHVRVWRLSPGPPTELSGFFAYDPAFRGGVRVAACDVDGDGRADIVTGAGPGGGPHVRVFAGSRPPTELASFFAYDPAFAGGVFVACGDVTGTAAPQIVTGAGAGGGPHVRVFAATGVPTGTSFFAYDPRFRGGVQVAVREPGPGAQAGGERPPGEILTGAGPGGGPHVRGFTATGVPTGTSFFAYWEPEVAP
jgi:hypothetical protein